ncbi:HGGxSTG domain-containing protein [Bradyrhizobium sp.]|uniref:HGGxSTG domain-containing protein n=1 Tax=Bradyrhizobium sp. TaxID=376 RepID=UPI003BB03804
MSFGYQGEPCKSAPAAGRRRCRMHGGAAGRGAPSGLNPRGKESREDARTETSAPSF